MKKAIFIVGILFSLLALAAKSQTQLGPLEEVEKISVQQRLSMLTTNDLGESYDPSSGVISFAYSDISLPGNSALKVELRRKLTNTNDHFAGLGELGNWSLDIPYIRGVYLDNGANNSGSYITLWDGKGWSFGKECEGDVTSVSGRTWDGSGTSFPVPPSTYWTGKFLNIPDRVSENLIWGKGEFVNKQISKSNYVISSCFPRTDGKGQGIVVSGPDGTRYTFNYVVEAFNGMAMPIANDGRVRWLLATRVEDKFGNYVSYNYANGRLQSITASDGRTISLNYEGQYLSSASANGRVWTYKRIADASGAQVLDEVILPDNRRWKLGELPSLIYANALRRQLISEHPGRCRVSSVTRDDITIETPNKLKITYSLAVTYHGVHSVKAYPEGSGFAAFTNVHCGAHWSLAKKTVAGPGMPLSSWYYYYSENSGDYYEGSGEGNEYGVGQVQNQYLAEDWSKPVALEFKFTKPASVVDAKSVKTTTVMAPQSWEIYYVDRTFGSPTHDMILATDYAAKISGKLLKRVENFYQQGALIGDYCALSFMPVVTSDYPYTCSRTTNQNNANYRTNLAKVRTTLYDSSGVATSYETQYADYDFYGVSSLKSESNSFSTKTRYEKSSYINDYSNWVLGMPSTTWKSETNSNFVESYRVEYVPKTVAGHSAGVNVPNKTYRFGQLDYWFKEYHADGNLKKIVYPNGNHWVEYSNFKRGIPQTITKPNTMDQTLKSAYRVVDDNGWVRQVTDFKGNKTFYDYDQMGRLVSAEPNNKQWLPTTISYREAAGDDLGLSGVYDGMLVQGIWKGDYLEAIYYDALQRPRIVTHEDMSDVASRNIQYFNYDENNQQVFQSYLSATPGESKGVSFKYDALQRLVATTRDTEAGQVTAYKSYLSDNVIQDTDFKNYVTNTSYLAYGSPDYSQPVTINSPESVVTSIDYNIWGNLISISQGGQTQYNVYDSSQNLCKQVRADIGNMAYAYNASGQVAWFAHGASVDSSTAACDAVVDAAAKVTYAYDNLDNLRSLTFGDGTSSKIYNYDKNNNLERLDFGAVTQVYSYDDLDNLTREAITTEGQTRAINYIYASDGNLSDIVYPTNHVVSYAPNALGQPTVVYNTTSGIFYAKNISYFPSGAVKGFTYGNGLSYSLKQNQQQLTESVEVKNSANLLVLGFGYTYDKNAKVESIADKYLTGYSTSFSYDGLGRLKTTNGYWGSGNYNYDQLGNITSYNLGSFSLAYNYSSTKRLNSVTGNKSYSFSYDERGNVTKSSSTGITYKYNLANQMVNAGTNNYLYDGYDRRVKKQGANGTEFFTYSKAGQLLYTKKASGNSLNYIYLSNQLIAKDDTANTTNIITDAQTNNNGFETGLIWKNTGTKPWVRGANGRTNGGSPLTSGPSYGSQGSNYYAYTGGYSTAAGNTAQLESNYFSARNLYMDFDYHMYGANVGYLYVDVFYKGTWTTVWSKYGQQQTSSTAAWKSAKISLHDFSGIIKVRMRAVAIGGGAGDIGVDSIIFSEDNQDPTPSTPAPWPSVQPPTVSISCSPCDASTSIMSHTTMTVPVTVNASCSGFCQVEWFYSGSSIFAVSGNGTSRSFTQFCGFSFWYQAQIWVKITDPATGLTTTSIKKPVSMRCS